MTTGVPRACGDEPSFTLAVVQEEKCSPRVRG